MLKRLTLAIAPIALALTAFHDIPRANAATGSNSQGTSQHQFIAKQPKSLNVDRQQADIASIHQTITQFYRGMNELNVDRMEKASVRVSAADKAKVEKAFEQIRANRITMSIEVRRMELVSISAQNATVKIDQVVKGQMGNRSTESSQTSSLTLVKDRGQWKIFDMVAQSSPAR